MTRKVREIMSAAPVCMAASESVSAAARAMKERGIGTVLVLSGGRFSGLVTDRDITIRVLAENRDPRTTRLGDICSGELAVRRLAVIADGTPVGVVSIGDLALDQDERSARSQIPASGPNR